MVLYYYPLQTKAKKKKYIYPKPKKHEGNMQTFLFVTWDKSGNKYQEHTWLCLEIIALISPK